MIGKHYGHVVRDCSLYFFHSSWCRTIYIILDVFTQWNQASEREHSYVSISQCAWMHILPNQSINIGYSDGIKYINWIKWYKCDRYMMWWAREYPVREKNRMGFRGIMEVFRLFLCYFLFTYQNSIFFVIHNSNCFYYRHRTCIHTQLHSQSASESVSQRVSQLI